MTYRLSPEIDLPPSAVTSTFAYLGIRGYGKSYAAGVQVEDFLGAGAQVVVVDPVGIWWGLRLNAGGNMPSGFDVPVFGGTHGDLPLEPTAGELVARIAAEQRRSMVLDVSDWTLGEQRRFVTAFATLLFQLKKANRSPIHLVFEEAHEFFPQFVEGASAPLVGATNRLWKIGRNYGIGGTLISQRAAEVNKSALNLTETLVTTRLRAPEDVKRIDGWVNANGTGNKAIALLPDLPKHQVIVWTDHGAVITKYRTKDTFDASRTPDDGGRYEPSALPPLDVAAIRQAMAATIEEAQANDPKALREKIRGLEKLIADGALPKLDDQKVLAQVARERDTAKENLDRCMRAFEEASRKHGEMWRAIKTALDATETMPAIPDFNHPEFQRLNTALPNPPGKRVSLDDLPPPDAAGTRAVMRAFTRPDVLGGGMARILSALRAAHPTPLSREQVALRAIMSPAGGTFGTYLSRLIAAGQVVRDGGLYRPTTDGLKQKVPAPMTKQQLVDLWVAMLQGKQRPMLAALIQRSPMTKATLADAVGMPVESGTFGTYLSRLQRAGVVVRARGGFAAADDLRS